MLIAACAALLNDALSMLLTVPSLLLALVKFIQANWTSLVDVSAAPWPVFWIVPPVPADPVPVMCRPPDAPAVSTLMPVVAPLTSTFWNVTSFAPMLVLAMLIAVPEPELIVLPVAVAVTVPPVFASNAVVLLALVLSVSVLVKPIVALVFPVRRMPSLALVEDTVPSNDSVPEVW